MIVPIIGFPVDSIALDIPSDTLSLFFISCLNLARKWIVSSTAIPSAIEKVIAVDGRSLIPENPIIAAAAIRGMILGRIDIRDSLMDLNRIIIDKKIIINARIKLVVRSLTKNP